MYWNDDNAFLSNHTVYVKIICYKCNTLQNHNMLYISLAMSIATFENFMTFQDRYL